MPDAMDMFNDEGKSQNRREQKRKEFSAPTAPTTKAATEGPSEEIPDTVYLTSEHAEEKTKKRGAVLVVAGALVAAVGIGGTVALLPSGGSESVIASETTLPEKSSMEVASEAKDEVLVSPEDESEPSDVSASTSAEPTPEADANGAEGEAAATPAPGGGEVISEEDKATSDAVDDAIVDDATGEVAGLPEGLSGEGVIGFAPNSSNLTAAGRDELDDIAEKIPSGAQVTVLGYVAEGSVPSTGVEFFLDAERAEVVAEYLTSKGVEVYRTEGRGPKRRSVVVVWN